jgi:hypothetical protein
MKKILILGAVIALPVVYQATGFSTTEEKLAKGYLAEANRVLQEVPFDGKLGVSRLPTIHKKGSFHDSKQPESEGTRLIKKLGESNFLACGTWSSHQVRSTMAHGLYQLNWKDAVKSKGHLDASIQFSRTFAPSHVQKLLASGKDYGTAKMKYVDQDATFYMQVVRATKQECLPCHSNVKLNEPVGVVGLLCLPK